MGIVASNAKPNVTTCPTSAAVCEHAEELYACVSGYRASMKRCGRVGLAATVVSAVGVASRATSASVDLDEVAGALRSNPVYVDADAERALTDDEIEELRSVIRER